MRRCLTLVVALVSLAAGRLYTWWVQVIDASRVIAVADDKHVGLKRDYLRKVEALAKADKRERRNVVLVLFDDLGYGDLENELIDTPRLDQLASESVRFQQFYSASAVCSPSRSSLLTGRLPVRTGVPSVLHPDNSTIMQIYHDLLGRSRGLLRDEVTLADVYKAAGFATCMVGKWHLGERDVPNDFGFDSFFGTMYSNDMLPLPLFRNRDVDDPHPTDQTRLAETYASESAKCIKSAVEKNKPFFLYVATNFPHIPLFASERQANKSKAGLYGDVVQDLDWQMGQLFDTLKSQGVDENTVIMISSDNGPWFEGSGGEFRGRKAQVWEGGQRVPFILRDPGLPANLKGKVVGNPEMPVSGLDVFPTLIQGYLGLDLPPDREIDGVDLSNFLHSGGEERLPERSIFMFEDMRLHALRNREFKLHLPHPISYTCVALPWFSVCPALHLGKHPILYDDGKAYKEPRSNEDFLFNLKLDPLESYEVTQRYPTVAAQLSAEAQAFKESIERNPRGWLL